MNTPLNNKNAGTLVTIVRNSKKSKGREIYMNNPSLSRDEVVRRFIIELQLPEGSARTYASEFAKELNPQLGKEYKTRNINTVNSKKNKAYEIYSSNASLPRNKIIELIQTQLNVTHNSASTHCSWAAKKFKETNNV